MPKSYKIKPSRVQSIQVNASEITIRFASGTTWLLKPSRASSFVEGIPMNGMVAHPSDMIEIETTSGVILRDGSEIPGAKVCNRCNSVFIEGKTKCDCHKREMKADEARHELEAVKKP